MDGTREEAQSENLINDFAPYLLNRIVHRYNQSVRSAMKEHGLSVPKMRAISALASQGDLTVNELSVFAVAEQSTMSRTLDLMERDGLIIRAVDGDDSRVRTVSLTDEGRSLHARIWPDMQNAEAKMFVGMDKRTRQTFLKTLNGVLENIRIHDI